MQENNNIITFEEFGKRLAMIRENLGLTQKELAEKLNKTQNAISLIESGKSASFKTIIPLLSYYSQFVYLNYLFSKDYKFIKISSLYKANMGGIVQGVLKEGYETYMQDLAKANETLQTYLNQASELIDTD